MENNMNEQTFLTRERNSVFYVGVTIERINPEWRDLYRDLYFDLL